MWLCNVGKCKPLALRQVFHGFFMGFSWCQPTKWAVPHKQFLQTAVGQQCFGFWTVDLGSFSAENVETSTPPQPPNTLHTRGQRASAARRGAISPGGPILKRLAHVSTDISESQTFCQFLSDISVCSLLFQIS